MKKVDFILDSLYEVARIIGQNKTIKSLLDPLWNPIRMHRRKRAKNKRTYASELFNKNGLQVLKDFDCAMEECGIAYTLAFGTLLGAIREHGFIKHDFDIDVAVWNDDYADIMRQTLVKYGFALDHKYEVDKGEIGREETYRKNGVCIDIFYFFKKGESLPYCCDFIYFPDCATRLGCIKKHGGFLPRKLELPLSAQRKKVKFEDTELYVPVNASEILEFRYGKDFMIPNPNWNIRTYDAHIVVMESKVGVFTSYE